ncbi:MAG: methyltransferase domain-containing protein [Pseudolabrys sp.]|nr:methyltransferase domain-containing protein [Pseudolabrys sp.]MSP32354.1 methyltransferase domain-containing protein [Pseudolabrys sp.]
MRLQPLPIHLPSGNLIVDRRFEWARDLEAKGDLAGAAGLLMQALELAPGFSSAWFALGELREKLGQRDAAIAAFREAALADRQDRHGAKLQLIRLGAAPVAAMPEAYVRALFDGYAPAFDQALTEGIGYRAPELLLHAVQAAHASARMKFGSMLDLGCGTGLGGAAFRPYCDWLVGVDLSIAMLAQARTKGLYDRLIEGEAAGFLDEEAKAKARYHLILAADMFMYLDDLAPVLNAAAAVLAPSAQIAFSVETHDGEGVILRDTLRYAHSAAHVRAALAAARLTLVSLESAATRTEKRLPVPGLIVVAGKMA